MTRNDTFFKFLFAIEIALLPLVAYAYYFIDTNWVATLLVIAVFVCMIWTEIFKDKNSFKSRLINSIGEVLAFGFVVIFFSVVEEIPTILTVLSIIFVIAAHSLKLTFFKKSMPEIIDAVEWSFVVFQSLAVLLISFIHKAAFLTNVGLIAVIITSMVITIYKVYYAFRYTYLWSNIKKLFRRR